jgi:hypothetical protein
LNRASLAKLCVTEKLVAKVLKSTKLSGTIALEANEFWV